MASSKDPTMIMGPWSNNGPAYMMAKIWRLYLAFSIRACYYSDQQSSTNPIHFYSSKKKPPRCSGSPILNSDAECEGLISTLPPLEEHRLDQGFDGHRVYVQRSTYTWLLLIIGWKFWSQCIEISMFHSTKSTKYRFGWRSSNDWEYYYLVLCLS